MEYVTFKVFFTFWQNWCLKKKLLESIGISILYTVYTDINHHFFLFINNLHFFFSGKLFCSKEKDIVFSEKIYNRFWRINGFLLYILLSISVSYIWYLTQEKQREYDGKSDGGKIHWEAAALGKLNETPLGGKHLLHKSVSSEKAK